MKNDAAIEDIDNKERGHAKPAPEAGQHSRGYQAGHSRDLSPALRETEVAGRKRRSRWLAQTDR